MENYYFEQNSKVTPTNACKTHFTPKNRQFYERTIKKKHEIETKNSKSA